MRRPISSVAVPELKVRTGRPPQNADSAASNFWFCGPVVIQPERSTSATPELSLRRFQGGLAVETDQWIGS